MKCVVTGGAGFIGSNLVDKLLSNSYDVVVIDNFDPYYNPDIKRTNIQHFTESPNFTLIEGDILDKEILSSAIEDADYVFHLAAQAGVSLSVNNPFKYSRVNIDGTLNVLEACRNASVKKLIFASSSSVYGKTRPLPFKEDMQKLPVSPYGVTKLAAEHIIRIYKEIYGLKSVSLRYFTVYGPRMRPDLAISIFVKNALSNNPIIIFGDGHRTRDFTYIDDIVDANIISMKKGEGEYNIAGGSRTTILELAHKIIEITNSDSEIQFSDIRKGDAEHTWADISLANKILEWSPKIKLEEGLKNMVSYFSDKNG